MFTSLKLWIGLGLALAPALVPAAPFLPAGDEVVLETLPVRSDPALAGLRQQRLAVQHDPSNLDARLVLARNYIEAARRNGDPRFLGYAQKTLSEWPDGAQAPAPVRVLRATALQSLHQFAAALHELDGALQQSPANAQALLTRATVLQVLGRYTEAQRDCAALLRSSGEIASGLCLASIASATGHLDNARTLAQRALDHVPDNDRVLKLWASTVLAETATREGDLPLAKHYFQQALVIDASDRYARAAYCDLLLDMGEPQAVLDLTAALLKDDNLLLRHAAALKALSRAAIPGAADPWQSQLQQDIRELAARHAAATQRGDRTHLREAARFELELRDNPRAALKLAQENWQVQREPADVRVLLEAARASGDEVALKAVVAWMQTSGLRDAGITALLKT
ncbi:MAG: hypothetical protein ABIP38_02655 [Steroidobacteraceae bacterium]